jgi:hypothetical protein
MRHFADQIIKPYLVKSRSGRVCEIGAGRGENTDKLLQVSGLEITVIDPCLDANLRRKFRAVKKVQVRKGSSLRVLRGLSRPYDCILIDGDHNWFTVFHELRLIEQRKLLNPGGAIFLHDVAWPYGRRDMYYRPELIPARFRQPYARKGIAFGRPTLSSRARFNRDLYNACREGGGKNGVLTAIEDFLAWSTIEYRLVCIEEEFGLAALFRAAARASSAIFEKLLRQRGSH